MFIPLGTDRPLKRPTLITYWLIGACVAVFFAQSFVENRAPDHTQTFFYQFYAFPLDDAFVRGEQSAQALVDPGDDDVSWNDFRPWQLVSYQFLHGGIVHLLGNMLFLFVFGRAVEDKLGRWWFLLFYLAGGAAAAAAHYLFETRVVSELPVGDRTVRVLLTAPVLGASGSIAAVTGAFLVLFPLTRIRILLVFFLIGVFMLPAWVMIVFAIAKDLVFSGLGADQGVARFAHLGGYCFGAAIAFSLLWRRVLGREPYDLFSLARQSQRRRAFREHVRRAGSAPWQHSAPTSGPVVNNPRRRRGRTAHDHEPAPDHAGRRAEISAALADGRPDDAARLYERLLEDDPAAVLARDAQLAVSNALFRAGRHDAAETAYRLFLERFKGDRECDEIRLMLALVRGRYLNDPIGARRALDDLDPSNLPHDHAQLAQTLKAEFA